MSIERPKPGPRQLEQRVGNNVMSHFEVEGGHGISSGRALSVEPQQTASQRLHRRERVDDVFTYEPDKEIASFQGFRSPWWKQLIYYLVGILTAGFSFLLCKWSPRLHILLSLSPCPLKDAQYVRIRLVDGRVDLERVQELVMPEPLCDSQPTWDDEEHGGRGGLLDWQVQKVQRLLEYRCVRYFFTRGAPPDMTAGAGPTFTPVPAVPRGFNVQLRAAAQKLAATGTAVAVEKEREWDLAERQMRYGKNEMAIPVKSIPMLVFNEMWHPFYVFQYFSILVWIIGDQYYSYAVCIAAITWFSIISAAVEAHRNMKRLAEIAHFECEVEVLRDGEVVRLPSSSLVPGDLVVVSPGTLPCDMVLMRGECIVDENMLTGESVPVRKVPYNPIADGLAYEPEKFPGCTLFGGTSVAQARAARHQKALAMVCRTRFYSAKGQLLRSILFPREHEESFIADSLKFILAMLGVCMALYVWAAVTLAQQGASADRIVVRFFDMITIAVPPALPACLTIATVFSIGRLRKKGIYVTSPDRITLAGQLDVICFDKTGTLTEQGLDLQGIVPVVVGQFHDMVSNTSLLPVQLVELLASCHGLARMGDALVGDPLDQKLFLATQWDMIDERPSVEGEFAGAYGRSDGGAAAAATANGGIDGAVGEDGGGAAAVAAVDAAEATGTSDGVHTFVRPPGAVHAFAIIKRFEFSAALQRNLVVVRAPDGSVAVFAKGSPEAIRGLVDPASVPHDFDRLLGELTREGLRVLALAAGDASAVPEALLLGWTQAETERGVGLRLVGLAVMANPLRKDTLDVIQRLQHASIRTVMVTGDHLRTAVSVAHKCAILTDQKRILLLDAADMAAPPPAAPAVTPGALGGTGTTNPAAAAAESAPPPGMAGGGGPVLSPDRVTTHAAPGRTYPSSPMPVPGAGIGHATARRSTGPGPAGEPTPMGDPSIQVGAGWAAALLQTDAAASPTPPSPPDGLAAQPYSAAGGTLRDAAPESPASPTGPWPAGRSGTPERSQVGQAAAALPDRDDTGLLKGMVSSTQGLDPEVRGAGKRGGSRRSAASSVAGTDGTAGSQPNGRVAHTMTPTTVATTAAAAAAGSALGALRLSVLDADGAVTETITVHGGLSGGGGGDSGANTVSELLAQLMLGEVECAVTGKGFNCLLAAPQLDLRPEPGTAPQEVYAHGGGAAGGHVGAHGQGQGQEQGGRGAVPLLLPVLQRAAVFARMSPDNKRDLMLLLGGGIDGAPAGTPHLGLRAGFCGDGANDCGALKAAHVGVSLCEAEASVAAPMTSKAQTIASMITVVAEGRCALMATYQIFQFIVAYALVQAFETNLMYTYALNLGNYQYLIEDLFFTTVLAALMGFTEPRSKLSRRRPLNRVMSMPLILSTAAQCGVVVVFQLASLWLLQRQPGYQRARGGPELTDSVAPENTVTYVVALSQFIILALVFNKGMPHRSPIWTNVFLVMALLAQTAFVLYTLFSTDKFNLDVQDMVDKDGVVDMEFRWKLLGLIVVMGACAFAVEYTCVGLVRLIDWARGRQSAA